MSIQYKMIERGNHFDTSNTPAPKYYPQVVRKQTIGIKQLADSIVHGKTKIAIETEATIRLLLSYVEDELLSGNSVCFEGFGTFALTAECREVNDPTEIRAESIHVKRVTFVASKPLIKRLKGAKFERAK